MLYIQNYDSIIVNLKLVKIHCNWLFGCIIKGGFEAFLPAYVMKNSILFFRLVILISSINISCPHFLLSLGSHINTVKQLIQRSISIEQWAEQHVVTEVAEEAAAVETVVDVDIWPVYLWILPSSTTPPPPPLRESTDCVSNECCSLSTDSSSSLSSCTYIAYTRHVVGWLEFNGIVNSEWVVS